MTGTSHLNFQSRPKLDSTIIAMILKVLLFIFIVMHLHVIELNGDSGKQPDERVQSDNLVEIFFAEEEQSADVSRNLISPRRFLRTGRGPHSRTESCSPTVKPSAASTSAPTCPLATRSPTSRPSRGPSFTPSMKPTTEIGRAHV